MDPLSPSGRVGLFGGTFNPIHLGHLHAAQEAMLALDLHRVVFVPNHAPPHRSHEAGIAAPHHRLAMVELAVSTHPRFFASALELRRPPPSYTVETVATLREAWPEAQLSFLTGADALMRYTWKDLDRLLGMLATFVCVTRPGFDLDRLRHRLDGLDLVYRERIQTLEIAGYAVSSTEIRHRVSLGRPIKYLVTREVEDYIAKFELYDSPTDPLAANVETAATVLRQPPVETHEHGGAI